MEAKRRPKDVGKKRNNTNQIVQQMLLSCRNMNVFASAAVGFVDDKSPDIVPKNKKKVPEVESGKQDTTRRTARRTRGGPEAKTKTRKRADGHRRCYSPAAAQLRRE